MQGRIYKNSSFLLFRIEWRPGIVDSSIKEYIRSLLPENLPDGKALVQQGVEIGKTIVAGKSRFLLENGLKSHVEYKKKCMAEGKIVWQIMMGLATVEEEVDAIKKIYAFSLRTGLEMNVLQTIPGPVNALPKEYRDKMPRTTSYELRDFEDYKAHMDAAPIEVFFTDYHLACPNALETTINALKAGSPVIGEFCQYVWDYPGFTDDLKRYSDFMRALGIMASKSDEYFVVETYLDDGYPGYFMDCTSYVGYALLEHYICTKLCGARISFSFGGLLSEADTRMGVAMAISKLLSTEDQPALSYINSSTTTQWDHDIQANYGTSVQELLFEILVERKYKMGVGIQPVSITEALAVPTLQELLDIFMAGKRAEEKAHEWDKYMDFTPLESIRDTMAQKAVLFFNNVLQGFKESGIDIEDPLQMIMVLKNFNRGRFEMAFHPSVAESGNGEFKPYFPTVLGRQTLSERDMIIKELKDNGYGGVLKNRKVVVASADCHTYGLLLVEGVLSEMGADVVNGGVDMDPAEILDLADETGSRYVGISAHNGQALDYARQLLQLSKDRNREYYFFMGGKLNAILPNHSEPTDIAQLLHEMGINATNDVKQTVRSIGAQLY
jgi:methylmalonyl-CoA mutase cobalamin-binding subunit